MNRKQFFKRIAITTTAGIIAPKVLMANVKTIKAEPVKVPAKISVDWATISGIKAGGKMLTALEVLDIWRETGILIYSSKYGNAPGIIEGEIEVVDIAKL